MNCHGLPVLSVVHAAWTVCLLSAKTESAADHMTLLSTGTIWDP